MQLSGMTFSDLLKKILFRQSSRHPRLQRLWGGLQTLSIFGMNYGGGGLIESSGEIWVLENVISPACRDIQTHVVFDVGANVGDYSLLVKQHIPSALVYAFEPSRSTFEQLIAQVSKANGPDGIKPYNIGFSDAEKTVELFSYSIEGRGVSLLSSIDPRLPTQVVEVRTDTSENIEVQTIDHFCLAEGIGRIDFLKLDVEGHELAVMRGARRMIAKGSVSFIQFEFGPANIYSRTFFYDFWSLLSEHYNLFRIIPQGIVPIAYYSEQREVFLTTNYLAVRKQDS